MQKGTFNQRFPACVQGVNVQMKARGTPSTICKENALAACDRTSVSAACFPLVFYIVEYERGAFSGQDNTETVMPPRGRRID